MADNDETMVKLVSSDGQVISVTEDIARMSKTLSQMMDDLGLEDLDGGIPLVNISHATLLKIVEWCTHHKDDPPLPDDAPAKHTGEISDWDKEFTNVEQEALFEILMASNYLDIKGLLHLVLATIAFMIKGKTTEELREIFGIEGDFTPEEEEAIRKDNAWCEEAEAAMASA